MYETSVDGGGQWRSILPDYVQNNRWWVREIKESIPDDVRNNCWWVRRMKCYPYQMIYKATVDGRGRWRNPCQMIHRLLTDETVCESSGMNSFICFAHHDAQTVYRWDQWMTTHTNMMYKKLLMNERDEKIHTRWCTKQLLTYETNKGLHIPDSVQNNCWWMREIMKSITDDVRKNWWWMRPMKDNPYQIVCKNLLMDERDEIIHTRWCMKKTVDG